jgi:hypothetical protein
MKQNMIKRSIFTACIFSINFGVLCQGNIGIGTTSPNSLAMVDITSTNKGMLVPRVALVSDTSPVAGTKPNGLLLWNTSAGFKTGIGFYYWNGSTWTSLAQVTNTVNNSGIVPAPTATNKAKSWSTDHQGNPAWRRPNKTTEYINNF